MTSLLTNTAAMVALQTLNQISKDLNTTNNRVSTGLRIAEARHSAAYWAISTTTDSDNGALGAVRDALALGRSTLDVTYNGLESVRDNLQKIKELLVAVRQPGVNPGNTQVEIAGLMTDIQNKAGAAVINEQNFLEVDSGVSGFTHIRSVVASFERSTTGIAIETIDLDLTNIKLYDANDQSGIIDSTTDLGGATTYDLPSIDIATLDMTISDHVQDLENWITVVDDKLVDVIAAQNQVGVNLSRIESQETFISALVDANDRAIGALVDADMEEESTRLRALQTQQQLSIQSLSIANTSAQNVLALFQ